MVQVDPAFHPHCAFVPQHLRARLLDKRRSSPPPAKSPLQRALPRSGSVAIKRVYGVAVCRPANRLQRPHTTPHAGRQSERKEPGLVREVLNATCLPSERYTRRAQNQSESNPGNALCSAPLARVKSTHVRVFPRCKPSTFVPGAHVLAAALGLIEGAGSTPAQGHRKHPSASSRVGEERNGSPSRTLARTLPPQRQPAPRHHPRATHMEPASAGEYGVAPVRRDPRLICHRRGASGQLLFANGDVLARARERQQPLTRPSRVSQVGEAQSVRRNAERSQLGPQGKNRPRAIPCLTRAGIEGEFPE